MEDPLRKCRHLSEEIQKNSKVDHVTSEDAYSQESLSVNLFFFSNTNI